ncbi:DUF3325 domain-containing protein (plasmid) [Azospirillum oryzae]|uniref:DUF3325 domain-containing protein n=1 Tax=Azospirillum oryzae TaxID=286727 RepID=A0A6N1AHW9_9PROT|nr:DUF3325 domain-containing protein [Azospirillum oryzae]KAA0587292.1 DUF3325 domain-containing protein [Azospirillum oryzae]QKS50648.1 DUF3325 domain-containing protein [Azospirillum oryzae]GLR81810.1 hypothetical protein GCM10007856_45000 [Azospirillum oryzae]
MPDILSFPAIFGLCYLAFGALALTVERHWRDLVDSRRALPRRTVLRLRCAAVLCMAAALSAAVHRDGAGFGILLWVLALTAGALAVSATVTWLCRPARGRTR